MLDADPKLLRVFLIVAYSAVFAACTVRCATGCSDHDSDDEISAQANCLADPHFLLSGREVNRIYAKFVCVVAGFRPSIPPLNLMRRSSLPFVLMMVLLSSTRMTRT